MPTELLTKEEHRVSKAPPPAAAEPGKRDEAGVRKVRRLRINAASWGLGSILVTALWVANQWSANGSFESFGHEGDPGEWNPTLWAVVVGLWGLVVGIMALGVRFRGRRIRFHVAAWTLGMLVLTPLWALLEWQDNGAFEQLSSSDQPGSWDPWILVVAGIWALAVAAIALYDRRPAARR